jgi:hypothetical protein
VPVRSAVYKPVEDLKSVIMRFLTTGRLTLPVAEPDREYLRSVRRGDVSKEDVISAIES